MNQKSIFLSLLPLMLLGISSAHAAMISSDSLGQDPAKVALCKSRSTMAKEKSVPFEINANYAKLTLQSEPGTTFVAIDGVSPQLIVCAVRSGTGRFEPGVYMPQSDIWRLANLPQKYEPGMGTMQGRDAANRACLNAAMSKSNRSDVISTGLERLVEISPDSPAFAPGKVIAGKKSERYDVVVEGSAFFPGKGPDNDKLSYTCLLTPMLDVKAVKIK
ncbi:hypothetical protein F3J28_21605 [Enterobacter sp. Ap-1006]|uniref:hypothetical protein n=1 Tax=Enterobacter sp. Ap-1006 TaxID=2608345 RepID=UPI00141EBEAB|nr:hypothetical protein [Enterobacter sp. Ap-1006]NIF50353.1 hypothetical protein [Enterobacter sp. Ap-1006]